MLQVMGTSARSRLGRWTRAAKNMLEEVKVGLVGVVLPDKMVFENPFLVGSTAGERLSAEFALKAIELAKKAMEDMGGGFRAEELLSSIRWRLPSNLSFF